MEIARTYLALVEKIRLRRKELRMSGDEVAQQMGLDIRTYMLMEKGRRELSVPQLLRLAEILQTNVPDLFAWPHALTEPLPPQEQEQEICVRYWVGRQEMQQRLAELFREFPYSEVSVRRTFRVKQIPTEKEPQKK